MSNETKALRSKAPITLLAGHFNSSGTHLNSWHVLRRQWQRANSPSSDHCLCFSLDCPPNRGEYATVCATVSNTSNTSVTWAVNGTTGGSSTVGTISTSGLYTAPGLVPTSSASVTVTATSQADTTISGSATVSLTYPSPTLSSVSPSYVLVNASDTTLTIGGSSFTQATTVNFNNIALQTTFVSATQVTAVLPAAEENTEGKFNITAVNPSPGGWTSDSY